MRVAHFCLNFSPLSKTFVYDYVTELDGQGVDSQVLTLERVDEEDRPYDKVTVVERPSYWHPRRIAARIEERMGRRKIGDSFWPLYRPRIEDALRRLQPDVVHAHFGPMGVLVQPVAEQLGLPLVVSFHGYDAFKLPQDESWKEALRRLLQKATAVTVVSDLMKDHLSEHVHDSTGKIFKVHVGKRMDDYPFEFRPGGNVERFVSVGRMTEKKGHLDCLKAFRKVQQECPSVSLEIIGGGEMEERVRQYVESNQVENVELLGRLPHHRVKETMSAADAFILCSKTAADGDREGIPTVLMEAQALGLPCVTTRHSGIPEAIPEEAHPFLAEEGNVDEIAESMQQLIAASPAELQYRAQKGREKVEREFDLTRETEKLNSLYTKSCKARSK